MRRASWILLALLALGGCAADPGTAPQPEPSRSADAEPALDAPIPLDARIRAGRLANGLAYYILPHGTPKKRAQLWLAVNAGSALEDEDQRGLAHFVEHMGFNGTRRFPKQALIDALERTGVQFGPDLNASTTLEATTYTLQIPTDEPGLVDTGLAILRDWAGDIAFDPADVDAERGVVLEEWRRGRGAWARLRDRSLPILFHASPLADRLPIGRPEIIRAAPAEALARYYRDWYRPERMAVIAVGDVDPAALEARIAAEFANLQAHAPPRERPDPALPPHPETLVSLETDPEASTTSVSLYTKLPPRAHVTLRDYRRTLAEALFHQMLNARLEERRREPNAGFLGASSSTGSLVRRTDAWVQRAVVPPAGVEAGLAALLTERSRVERHGFTAGELERAKRNLLRRYELGAARRERRDSRTLAAGIARHFYEQRYLPGSEADLALATRLLPTIELATLRDLVGTFWAGSRVIVVQGPAEMKAPSAESLQALVRRAPEQGLEPYRDRVASEVAVALPPPGAVVRAQHIETVGVTEWQLANGVRVVVKPTDFARDEVRMLAFSPGGHSLAADADFDAARFSDLIVEDAGVGSLDPVALRKVMAGSALSLRARIGELEESVAGTSAPRDLESLLRLAHLAFTAPRRDEAAFHTWRTRQLEAIRNRRASPERVFFEEMEQLLTQDHPRRRPLTAERIRGIELDRALAFYRDRFADAGDIV
jgi:zinc protease